MKFSFLWLKRHLGPALDGLKPSVISNLLTSIGLEVEELDDISNSLRFFIVAQITEVTPHEDSNKLNLCKVDTGSEILDIVCGANNVKKGIKIILAPIGSTIPSSNLKIKKSKILGKESSGMICSLSELNLGKDIQDGIAILPEDAPIGTKLTSYNPIYADAIYDVAITPNRGDCTSVLGISTDLSACLQSRLCLDFTTLNIPKHYEDSPGTPTSPKLRFNCTIHGSAKKDTLKALFCEIETTHETTKFQLNKDIEQLYSSVYGASELSLVNLSNFLMFDLGNPSHFYDANKIEGSISIRHSTEGETFVPITDKQNPVKLPAGLLVIADDTKILSLAGVMGDARSKTTAETTKILLEVAIFSPKAVIRSSSAVNIKSDSSYRFERGVRYDSPEILASATLQALNQKPLGVTTIEGDQSAIQAYCQRNEISLNHETFKSLSGYTLSVKQMCSILKNLKFEIIKSDETHTIAKPPLARHDIQIEEDLIEEILRISGYDNIKSDPSLAIEIFKKKTCNLHAPIKGSIGTSSQLIFKLKKALSSSLNEVISFSFGDEASTQLMQYENSSTVQVENPISKEHCAMRNSMLPGLLDLFKREVSLGKTQFAAFEIGKAFHGTSPEKQQDCLGIVRSGPHTEPSRFNKTPEGVRDVDIFDLKHNIERVLTDTLGLKLTSIRYAKTNHQNLHPDQQFAISLGNRTLAIIAQLNPVYSYKALGIKQKIFVAEVYLHNITEPKSSKVKFTNTGTNSGSENLMTIHREISILLPRTTQFQEVLRTIESLKITALSGIKVLDVFEDHEKIGPDLKSVSLQFEISQTEGKILTKEEIDRSIISDIVSSLSKKFGAVLRDGKQSK